MKGKYWKDDEMNVLQVFLNCFKYFLGLRSLFSRFSIINKELNRQSALTFGPIQTKNASLAIIMYWICSEPHGTF